MVWSGIYERVRGSTGCILVVWKAIIMISMILSFPFALFSAISKGLRITSWFEKLGYGIFAFYLILMISTFVLLGIFVITTLKNTSFKNVDNMNK